jgi:hypothetical protein
MEWFALIIPLLGAGMLLWKFRTHIVPWELAIPFAVVLIVTLSFKYGTEFSLTRDTEYWGNYLVEARYYEDWNEYISKTCYEDVPCGEDSDGNTKYCSKSYDCSYVDYHSEYWSGVTNSGEEFDISEDQFNEFTRRFGNKDFVELDRDYHTDDGDMYKTDWDKRYETFEFVASEFGYENRIPVSQSTFNYPDPDSTEISQYGLFPYQSIKDWKKLDGILSQNPRWVTISDQHKMNFLNGTLGAKKEVRAWLILFEDKPLTAGLLQEALWEGGNKNEIVTCVGLDGDMKVSWCHVFSWSESESLKTEIRYFVQKQDTLDVTETLDFLYTNIDKDFVRRPWDEFSYLTVALPLSTMLWIFILSVVTTIGVCIWVVKNEFRYY